MLEKYVPRYHLHGHVHLQYTPNAPRTRQFGDTTVVNVSGKYFIELPDRPHADGPRAKSLRELMRKLRRAG